MIYKKLIILSIIGTLLAIGSIYFLKQNTYAVTASGWKAGAIIDDSLFMDKDSMSVTQIQSFLNSKVGTGSNGIPGQCDTNGTRASELGGGTRAQYGSVNNNPAPFTCLKDFWEVPKTIPGPAIPDNNYGGKPIPSGARSAAQLIWDAAQKYNISPNVLLVKLGTESAGPLTSDDWPFLRQYTYAMGAHCPDVWDEAQQRWVAKCDPDYSGFSIQISEAASLLRWYLDSMTQSWWPYRKPYQINSIKWNIPASCGAANVFIENKATAALYTYTPYQPNQAALNNMYGLGDGCSAYGNRNFWRTYSDWFGPTTAINGSITISKGLSIDKSSVIVGDTVTATYEVSNSAGYDIDAGVLGVCARLNGANYDFGSKGQNIILANGKIVVSYTKQINQAGELTIYTCAYLAQAGGWISNTYPYNINSLQKTTTIQVQDNPLVTTGVALSPANPIAGQTVTATFTVTNASSNPIDIGSLFIATRDPNGNNSDFPTDPNVTVPANSTYTYSKSRILTIAGGYSFYIADYRNNMWYRSYPKSSTDTILRQGTIQVQDNPLVTTGVALSPANPIAGQTVTATFTVTNASSNPIDIGSLFIATRDPNGNNSDFPTDPNVTVPANSTYTYSKSRILTIAGGYSFYIADYRNATWDLSYPKSSSGSILRKGTFQVQDNPLITTSVATNPTNPIAGQTVTATFTITNASSNPIDIGALIIAARDPSGRNVDFPMTENVTIAANYTYTYSKSRILAVAGNYTLFVSRFKDGAWNSNYLKVAVGINKSITVQVQQQ